MGRRPVHDNPLEGDWKSLRDLLKGLRDVKRSLWGVRRDNGIVVLALLFRMHINFWRLPLTRSNRSMFSAG
jgi:hypothetical protein